MTTEALPGYYCPACAATYTAASLAWRCTCGSPLDLAFTATRWMPDGESLWRYSSALPVEPLDWLSLGEGGTPLVAVPGRHGIQVKADLLMPTGSFKDRGAVMLAALAARLGISRALVDSSGNAGTALSAYFARLGVALTVMVPEATSVGKLAQMTAHGANVVRIPGDRDATAHAAYAELARDDVFYASHVWSPYFFQGTKTYVFEIWEQLGGALPDTLVLPVGNGTMVLGAVEGIRDLMRIGMIDTPPHLLAVQASSCAPLAARFGNGDGITGTTVAEGIAIGDPPRGQQIVAALRGLGGTIVTVTDGQILAARTELARQGWFLEPTGAVSYAAVLAGHVPEGTAVALLGGHGLKSPKVEASH